LDQATKENVSSKTTLARMLSRHQDAHAQMNQCVTRMNAKKGQVRQLQGVLKQQRSFIASEKFVFLFISLFVIFGTI
jgi:replication-associated recombination protein RarA